MHIRLFGKQGLPYFEWYNSIHSIHLYFYTLPSLVGTGRKSCYTARRVYYVGSQVMAFAPHPTYFFYTNRCVVIFVWLGMVWLMQSPKVQAPPPLNRIFIIRGCFRIEMLIQAWVKSFYPQSLTQMWFMKISPVCACQFVDV